MKLTANDLRARVEYDPATGLFKRLLATGRHGCHKAGQVLGTDSRGYVVINLGGTVYGAHRLAWLYVHGEWPALVDHINGNPGNNRLSNLRSVTQTENMQNLRGATRNSKSGLLGTSWSKSAGKWVAHIRIGGMARHIGYYPTAEEAHAAYVTAKREHHPGGTL